MENVKKNYSEKIEKTLSVLKEYSQYGKSRKSESGHSR